MNQTFELTDTSNDEFDTGNDFSELELEALSDTGNKYLLSEYGTAGQILALGVQGDNRFQTLAHNFLVNYGVISPYAKKHQLFNNFCYFVVDINKYRQGLYEYFMNLYWIDNRAKGAKIGDGRILCIQKVRDFVSDIKRENFMQFEKTKDTHYYYAGNKD